MNGMTSEIDAAREEISALRAECARLRAQLERCQHRAMEIVRCWGEYHELALLKDRFERVQRLPRKRRPNGHNSQPVIES
jgi:hypothetical protein